MGATSTMHVSRDDALAAIARIEHANLDDDAVAERLNALLVDNGHSLDEVSIGGSGDAWDVTNLERIAGALAR